MIVKGACGLEVGSVCDEGMRRGRVLQEVV